MRLLRCWVLGAALLVGSLARAQSVIELRPTAYIAEGTPVKLGQIARLEGPEAAALAQTEVSSAAPKAISIEELRRALEASGRINWGRITLRGSSCTLLGPAPEPRVRPPHAEAEPEAPALATNTVRAAVTMHLARMLRAAPEDLQLTFAPEDADFLNTPTTGRTVEVHPTALAEKMPLRIAVYERDRMIGGERTVRVTVRVRRDVPVAFVGKRRGETIAPGDFSTESRWVSPTMQPATSEQLTGAAARDRVNAGEIIEADDAVPAFVVGKGDIVAVRCISGGIILGTRARAMGPGRDGDLVEFQALDSKRRFFARMDGRGRAIVTADAPEPDLQAARPRPATLPVRGGRIPPPISPEDSR